MNNFNQAYHTQDSLLMYESDGLETQIENNAKKNWCKWKIGGGVDKLTYQINCTKVANQTPAAFSFRAITIFGSNLLKQLLRLFASIHPHNIKLFLSTHWERQITPYTSCWDCQFITIFFLSKQSLWFILWD